MHEKPVFVYFRGQNSFLRTHFSHKFLLWAGDLETRSILTFFFRFVYACAALASVCLMSFCSLTVMKSKKLEFSCLDSYRLRRDYIRRKKCFESRRTWPATTRSFRNIIYAIRFLMSSSSSPNINEDRSHCNFECFVHSLDDFFYGRAIDSNCNIWGARSVRW